ncbi:HK97 family phage prohead protease [Comamonas terrigena]|uniref:HK97 family phage prohead protease n=1 Tax=Comamonas terrigena TaxID=32013 RepID=UPI00244B3F2E|nr:HK97 family phage prohead protease [Comamonas terrigena]MDH0049638.1 HK97 family phage prohead protease [Comamonas terrigena]MDH0511290.1 HK97 family phage prohead protease [Comamonas terrigena]MDH1091407.1 HK97 family phage prohead protease [Comamonas terrigena]
MDRLIAPIEIKEAKADGTFTGYAAVFNNVDLGRDILLPGAFKKMKTTSDGMVRIAMHHNLKQLAGKAKCTQDGHGLHVEGQLTLGVSYVRDAYELMKAHVLDGLSVGFDILDGGSSYEERDGIWVREIGAAELWEFSLVPFGMNPEALVETVKAATNIRDFEAQLRGLGYSQREAKSLAAGGFKSLGHRDGGLDSETLADEITNLTRAFNWS